MNAYYSLGHDAQVWANDFALEPERRKAGKALISSLKDKYPDIPEIQSPTFNYKNLKILLGWHGKAKNDHSYGIWIKEGMLNEEKGKTLTGEGVKVSLSLLHHQGF